MNRKAAIIPVDALDYADAVSCFREFITRKRNGAAYVVQSNAYTVVTAQEDAEYRLAVESADLSLPDGMPLVWLLRREGVARQERVYGPDLMLNLCAEAAAYGWRCFLLGGKPGTPERLRDTLEVRFPGIRIVGTASPPFRTMTEEEDRTLCAAINEVSPDIIWVGLGSPKQDLWMFHHRSKLHAGVLHGVGAAFDFLTGQVPQAPRWIMAAGFEWLYRLVQEPVRLWRRYTLTNIRFLWYIATRKVIQLRRRPLEL